MCVWAADVSVLGSATLCAHANETCPHVHKVSVATGGQSYLGGAAIVDIVLTCSMTLLHHGQIFFAIVVEACRKASCCLPAQFPGSGEAMIWSALKPHTYTRVVPFVNSNNYIRRYRHSKSFSRSARTPPMSPTASGLVTDSHGSPTPADITYQQFLQMFPHAAYTTMHIQAGEVYDLELHLQRLSKCERSPSRR